MPPACAILRGSPWNAFPSRRTRPTRFLSASAACPSPCCSITSAACITSAPFFALRTRRRLKSFFSAALRAGRPSTPFRRRRWERRNRLPGNTAGAPRFPVCVVFGHEVEGIQPRLSALCDTHVRIPMLGAKHSLNVATAGGVVLYELLRKYRGLAVALP